MIEYLTQIGPHMAYFILLLGSCVEGESIVLTAGFLSYTGFLKLEWVMLIAFCGTLITDQVLYFVGYKKGPALLERHPEWQKRTEKIFYMLRKYDMWFILGFRFVYGIRTLSPLIIGIMKIPVKRFVILNLIAAIIWTIISCSAGYLLGYLFADHIEDVIEKIGHYQKVVFLWAGGVLVVLGTLIWIYRKIIKNSKKDKNRIDPKV